MVYCRSGQSACRVSKEAPPSTRTISTEMTRSCYTVHLVIPEDAAERPAALASLETMLARIPETGFAEVWVMHGRFPALCALLNGDRGWLTCLRAEGDAGFSSRNPGYAGPPDAEIEFTLSTGQVDRYPA